MYNSRIGIVSPPYTAKSAGIGVLHLLIHKLREYGFDAYFIPQCIPANVNPVYNTPLFSDVCADIAEIARDWVVLYPEGVYGNPMNARRVVRYLLNKERAFGGAGMGALGSDFLITYSRLFHPTAPVLFYPVIEGELLVRSGRVSPDSPRTVDAFYVGKGSAYGVCPPIPNATAITRGWPETKAKYYDLLETVHTLHSYDWVTSTVLDAILLGCKVRLIGSPGPTGEGDPFREDGELFGLWERSPDDGVPQTKCNARELLLSKTRLLKSRFDARMVELFSQICQMPETPVS